MSCAVAGEREGRYPPHRKVENNYLAACRAVALAEAETSAKPEGRRKRWRVKEITRFLAIRIRLCGIEETTLPPGLLHMTASSFETAASRPPQDEAVMSNSADFLILRASVASVSKDEKIQHSPCAIILPSPRGGVRDSEKQLSTVCATEPVAPQDPRWPACAAPLPRLNGALLETGRTTWLPNRNPAH